MEPSQTKPDLIAVKLTPIFPDQPNLLPHINSKAFLWIECKSSRWKNALAEALGYCTFYPNGIPNYWEMHLFCVGPYK